MFLYLLLYYCRFIGFEILIWHNQQNSLPFYFLYELIICNIDKNVAQLDEVPLL